MRVSAHELGYATRVSFEILFLDIDWYIARQYSANGNESGSMCRK